MNSISVPAKNSSVSTLWMGPQYRELPCSMDTWISLPSCAREIEKGASYGLGEELSSLRA